MKPRRLGRQREMKLMINEKTAGLVIEKALSKGGDFAEIFCENTVKNNISSRYGRRCPPGRRS